MDMKSNASWKLPAEFIVESGNATQIQLTWIPVPGAAGYHIYRSLSEGAPFVQAAAVIEPSFTDVGLQPGTTYHYRVLPVQQPSLSTFAAVGPRAILPAPTNLQASAAGPTSISLTWDAVGSATGYRIFRSDSSGGTFSQIAEETQTNYTDTGLSPNTTYYYKVAAMDSSDEGTQSAASSATTQPSASLAAPANPSAQAVGQTEINLTWDTVSGATGYAVYRGTSAGGPYTKIATPTQNSYSDTGLTPGTTYYYQVAATDSSGEGTRTAEFSAATAAQLPAPGNVTAQAQGPNSIQLTWDAVGSATGYRIFRSDSSSGPFSEIGTETGTSYTDTGLTPSTTYYYQVAAYDASGDGVRSANASATTQAAPLPAPANPSAQAASQTEITLTWDAVPGASSYTVYRSSSASGPFTQLATPAQNSYTDSGLTPNTPYFYKVSATGAGGEGAQSAVFSAVTLAAPTNAEAQPAGTDAIGLTWNAVPGATGYALFRSTRAGGPFTQVASPTTNSYTDSGLTSGTTYYYQIAATDASGQGVRTAELSASTQPAAALAAPANPSAQSAGSDSISLTWDAVPGASSYAVYRSTSASGPFAQVASPAQTSYTDTGLSPDTTYYYRIAAADASGQGTQTATISASTQPAPLPAPANVTAQAQDSGSIRVSWNAVTGATGYRIFRAADAAGPFTEVAVSSGTDYTDSGLTPGTTYYYQVAAFDASGDGTRSGTVSAATPAAPLPAPTNLFAAPLNSSSIRLTWTPVAGATGYYLYRSLSPDSGFQQIAAVSDRFYTDSGLSPSTTYYYRAAAYDASGTGALSDTASATTMSAPLPAPASLNATAVGPASIQLSWPVVPGAQTYAIYRSTSPNGPFEVVAGSAQNTYTDTGLTPGVTYYYQVAAVDASGTGAMSPTAAATTTAIPAPGDVTAQGISPCDIQVRWSAVPGASQYVIYRSLSADGPFIAAGTALGTSFRDTGLNPGTAYYYRVAAVAGGATGPLSPIVSAETLPIAPPVPTDLRARALSCRSIAISWSPVPGAERYVVTRSLSPTGPFTQIASSVDVSYPDTNLMANTTYYYQVAAVVNGVTGTPAGPVSAVTLSTCEPPCPPPPCRPCCPPPCSCPDCGCRQPSDCSGTPIGWCGG